MVSLSPLALAVRVNKMSFPCVITSVAAMPERWNKGGEQSAATAIGRPAENTADVNRPYGDISHADGLALTEASYELCCIIISGFFQHCRL